MPVATGCTSSVFADIQELGLPDRRFNKYQPARNIGLQLLDEAFLVSRFITSTTAALRLAPGSFGFADPRPRGVHILIRNI